MDRALFVPDAVLAAGLLAAGVWRERRVAVATWLGTLGSLALILYLFVASPARRWSLPVVPPFGG
jgi:hypothetical protein